MHRNITLGEKKAAFTRLVLKRLLTGRVDVDLLPVFSAVVKQKGPASKGQHMAAAPGEPEGRAARAGGQRAPR